MKNKASRIEINMMQLINPICNIFKEMPELNRQKINVVMKNSLIGTINELIKQSVM